MTDRRCPDKSALLGERVARTLLALAGLAAAGSAFAQQRPAPAAAAQAQPAETWRRDYTISLPLGDSTTRETLRLQAMNQARERAAELAVEGKAKASDAIAGIGQIVAENAPAIDEKLGPKYGDYARSAARTMQETAARLEAKDLNELGDDAKEFVRKSPGLAVGLAAVAGFMIARLFKKSDS